MKRSLRRIIAAVSAAITILICFSLTSCNDNPDNEPRLYIDDYFSWAPGNYEDTIEDAQNLPYKKLERMGYKNISQVAGTHGDYVWVKAEFTLPEELKNDDLSMVVPYLHFAEELYLNGYYIDDYGVMGEGPDSPGIQEAGYGAHLFDFPESFLNQDGVNVIHIKIFALGAASITDGVFIGKRQDCWKTSDNQTFYRTRVYVFFEGGMLICGIFFLMLYFAFKRERSYLRFAVLNILSIIFFSNFFVNDVPWVGFHGGFPFVLFFKFAKCICFFALEAEFALFVLDYLHVKANLIDTIIRAATFIVNSAVVILAPDYHTLMRLTYPVLVIAAYNFISPIVITAIHCRKKSPVWKEARFLGLSLLPLLVTIFIDFALKTFAMDIKHMYYSAIGWMLFIIILFVYFSVKYNGIAGRLEYLNKKLEFEIQTQTEKLVDVNKKLENDQKAAQQDMEMAAIVQKKFFHAPDHELNNWDFSVIYKPRSIVSGDLFNFYHEGPVLNGISLFDASGHGVAASLVTMLAENIIQQTYRESLESGANLADTLSVINSRFITAKEGIDNYLTGILLSTKENEDGSCLMTLSNAGHPYPLLYSAANETVEEILPDVGSPFSGPVGLRGFDITYSQVETELHSGDIVLLYTDGLTEIANEAQQQFGLQAVIETLRNNGNKSSKEIMELLMKRVDTFCAGSPHKDDISVIILKRA
jgi:sigma-B regulation protein RsbU (phosphoserine phosphatase)